MRYAQLSSHQTSLSAERLALRDALLTTADSLAGHAVDGRALPIMELLAERIVMCIPLPDHTLGYFDKDNNIVLDDAIFLCLVRSMDDLRLESEDPAREVALAAKYARFFGTYRRSLDDSRRRASTMII